MIEWLIGAALVGLAAKSAAENPEQAKKTLQKMSEQANAQKQRNISQLEDMLRDIERKMNRNSELLAGRQISSTEYYRRDDELRKKKFAINEKLKTLR